MNDNSSNSSASARAGAGARKIRVRITAEQQAQVRFWTQIGRREPSDFHGARARNKIQQILGDDIFEALWEDEGDSYVLELVETKAETGIFAPPLPSEAHAPPGPCRWAPEGGNRGGDPLTRPLTPRTPPLVPPLTPPPTVGYGLSDGAPDSQATQAVQVVAEVDPIVQAWADYHTAVARGEDGDEAAMRAGFSLGAAYRNAYGRTERPRRNLREQITTAASRVFHSVACPSRPSRPSRFHDA